MEKKREKLLQLGNRGREEKRGLLYYLKRRGEGEKGLKEKSR